ncbi:MAG: type VII secretion protein EccCa [Dactylosporangium sp.]|nr:type VII secretion protein EccCa [Dactylosporangium sp.]NNJ63242.1 type VII secretion protein EccCa [Dactylosporangium sp.]
MSSVVVKRQPRRAAPSIPDGEIVVLSPPEIPQTAGSRWQQTFQLLPMLTGTIATALLFAGQRGGTYSYVIGGIFGVSTLGMLATSWSGAGLPRKAEMIAARREYLRHLSGLRRRVRATVAQQQAGLHYRHPRPDQLWSTASSFRLWERRPADADFAVVRVAVGPQSLATPLVCQETRPLEELEPMTAGALRRFLDAYSIVPDLPIAISLRGFSRVFIRGRDADTRGLTRAIIGQLAVFHAPEDVLIAICTAPDLRATWEWGKWLPHALHPTRLDAVGRVRLIATSARELEERLDDLITSRPRFTATAPTSTAPRIVVVLDGGDLSDSQHLATEGGIDAVTILDLDTVPPRVLDRSMIVLNPSGVDRALVTTTLSEAGEVGLADTFGAVEAEALARRLAPLRLATAGGGGETPLAREQELTELLDIGDPYALDASRAWRPRPHRDRLRVPIGVGGEGQPIELDLKESAQDGMGPHGLLIGATGSGKSELLRTLVLGLATTHSSETLNFVLIDYKGGATFTSLCRLPHVAAVITNLSDELPLVDRMTDAINGELVRRQELLRRAGNFASARDYEKARLGGAALAALPSLLIICDEFSELLAAKPDFIDLFVQIGRVGRSLGVHLLLASQRLEEGRLRGLDTHLSYRVGLRTFSALESRTVLGVPDAFELPRSPGHGYLRFGTEPLERFKAAYVSGPYRVPGQRAAVDRHGLGHQIVDYPTHYVPPPVAPDPADECESPDADASPQEDSLLDIIVDQLAGRGVPAHQVWLPPLTDSPALNDLLGPVAAEPDRGLTVVNPQLRGALRVPTALVDKPFEQRRDLLWLQLDGAAGHVAIVGGPQSGKSTAIRTMIVSLALTHTPTEVQVYCLDFGGGQLTGLRELPHVGGVAGRLDLAAVRRTVAEIATLLTEREQRFSAGEIDTMAAYRRQRAASASGTTISAAAANDAWGDVFLVIDGWATLRGEYDDLEPVITDIATRGLSYGVHVVAAASRWMDFRPAIRDLFGSRMELRLGDPSDSMVARRAAANVPQRSPGRGLTAESLHFLTALPQLGSDDSADLVRSLVSAWSGRCAPPVRLLPTSVSYSVVEHDRAAEPLALPVGIAESDLKPVRIDFSAEPHTLLFGDAECGKSTFLRALGRTIVSRFTPEQARIILVDYRRSLLGAIATEHLIGYGSTAASTQELIGSVAGYMERRLPGQDVTAEQLRARSWWTGPECFVLIDDYDLVATGPSNPLLPLLEYLPQARDVGLHLVVTRRSGGAGRSLYEPVIQRLRELSSPGIVLSGDREEGALISNVRPSSMPPGRGWLVTRREGARLVQLADLPDG